MRFKENYRKLSDRVKKRLVLENDDMCWSVEDLLPTCQELGIPMILVSLRFPISLPPKRLPIPTSNGKGLASQQCHTRINERRFGPSCPEAHSSGTQDILQHIPAITALWQARGITPKQHYSEPRNPNAIIPRDLRPHSKRVYSLPPCDPTMDLMIEAKDKEQAVFELRRKWDIEGGVPSEWELKGEKMDEEREVPSYKGVRVFYEEGADWRFKPPIKMPVKVSKVLEKLEKEKVKVEKQREKVEDDEGELKRIEMELVRIEEDRKKVTMDWHKEKRIKWGLEKKVDQ